MMTKESRDELIRLLVAELQNGACLEDILMATAEAVAMYGDVRPSVAISRVHFWAHCHRFDTNGSKG